MCVRGGGGGFGGNLPYIIFQIKAYFCYILGKLQCKLLAKSITVPQIRPIGGGGGGGGSGSAEAPAHLEASSTWLTTLKIKETF